MTSVFDTHDVFNQSPPFVDVNLFGTDRPLQDAVNANGARTEVRGLDPIRRRLGCCSTCSSRHVSPMKTPPKLRLFDSKGHRLDIVEFHPAYHAFMRESIGDGLAAMTWDEHGRRAGAPSEVARAARYYMVAQVENGHMCPVTMTRAAVAALAAAPALLARVMPKIDSRQYESEFRSWSEKSGDHHRHGHDRETGRHRRARQHDARRARRRWLSHHRTQMVHVGADVRCVSGAGASARWAHLLFHAALHARREL